MYYIKIIMIKIKKKIIQKGYTNNIIIIIKNINIIT